MCLWSLLGAKGVVILEHIWALFSVKRNCNATETQTYSRQRFGKLPGYGCNGTIKPLSFSVERIINRINHLINGCTFLC